MKLLFAPYLACPATACGAGRVRGVGPDRWKVDADIDETIGIDKTGDEPERQVVAVDRVHRHQRPAGVELDRPEAVELDRRARAVGQLLWHMKAQRRTRVRVQRERRQRPVPTEAPSIDPHRSIRAGSQRKTIFIARSMA